MKFVSAKQDLLLISIFRAGLKAFISVPLLGHK